MKQNRGFAALLVLLITTGILGYLIYSGKFDPAYIHGLMNNAKPIQDAQSARDKANAHERAIQQAVDETSS